MQTELCVRVGHPTYGWLQARAEVEFLHRSMDGVIVPVEVKSGGRQGNPIETWPLYDAQFLGEL